jgi:hypothetical protein
LLPKSESRTRPTPTPTHTSPEHNTISLSPYTSSSFRTTSVHRSSAYGKDYITSHFAAHKAQRLYDIKGSRNTTDGRTDGRHGAFPSCVSSVLASTDCISSGRDRTERRNKSLSLASICFRIPHMHFPSALYLIFQRTVLGRFGIKAREDFYGGRCALGGTRLPLGYTHFRLIRLSIVPSHYNFPSNQTFQATSFVALMTHRTIFGIC